MDEAFSLRPTQSRYDYIDALRGWAVLGVVAVHCASETRSTFPGASVALAGQYGVQLFFMVSAFTIFLTLDRSAQAGHIAWDEFYLRRFFRILPMFWVGLALYSFAPGRTPMYDDSVRPGAADYLLTATLQHGWHPLLINLLVPGGWSIAVEGAFYLLAPLCFRVVRTWQAALWLLLGSLLLSTAANSVAAALYAEQALFAGASIDLMKHFIRWWFPAQMPVFACGILLYQVSKAMGTRPPNKGMGTALVALSAVLLCSAVDIGRHGWIAEHVYFAIAFVPLILGLGIWPTSLLVNQATRFLGRISYSVYLLHFMFLRLSASLLPGVAPVTKGSVGAFALLFAATLAGTVGTAWLTWRLVEQPCIDLGAGLIRSRRAERARGSTDPGKAAFVSSN